MLLSVQLVGALTACVYHLEVEYICFNADTRLVVGLNHCASNTRDNAFHLLIAQVPMLPSWLTESRSPEDRK